MAKEQYNHVMVALWRIEDLQADGFNPIMNSKIVDGQTQWIISYDLSPGLPRY